MKWGVDASLPPAEPECLSLQAAGFSFVCGYLGGRTPRAWAAEEFLRCAQHELDVMPIWVAPLLEEPGRELGVAHGNAALQAMMDRRLSGILALDIENGLFPTDYAQGFADAVHAGSCQILLYGDNPTLEVLADLFDFTWLALWGRPELGNVPWPADMWQYLNGSRYDFNVADNTLPFAGLDLSVAPQ